MTTAFITITLCLALSFVVSLTLTKLIYNSGLVKLKFLSAYLTAFIGFIVLYTKSDITYDQINPVPLPEIIALFVLCGIIYLLSLSEKYQPHTYLLTLVSSVILGLMIPADFHLFDNYLPLFIDRAVLIALIFIIAHGMQYLNNIDGLVNTQNIFIHLSVFVLYLIGTVPFLIGGFSAIMLGITASLFAFTWFPSAITLSPAHCNILGLIAAWILLRCSVEGAATCSLILVLFLFAEIAAMFYRAAVSKQKGVLLENYTNSYQTFLSGMRPDNVCLFAVRIFIFLAFFSAFQTYAPNAFTMPAFGLVLVIWLLSRMLNWQKPVLTLKEINKEVIEEIKGNINELKDSLSKNKEEKFDEFPGESIPQKEPENTDGLIEKLFPEEKELEELIEEDVLQKTEEKEEVQPEKKEE